MFGLTKKIKKEIRKAIVEMIQEVKETPKEFTVKATTDSSGKVNVEGKFSIKF